MLTGMTRHLDIAATTQEALHMEADAFAVIDVLRATTTIAVMFERGLTGLWVTDTIDHARQVARTESALLFGEVGGLPPEGFDHGNSPVEASTLDLSGAKGVLFTTNGTVALTTLADRGVVVAASVVNAGAVIAALESFERVVVACAGVAKGTRFALEDFGAAAYLVQRLAKNRDGIEFGDLARHALEVAQPLRLIPDSYHGQVVRSLGLGADIDFAINPDTCPVVPRVTSHGKSFAFLENAADTHVG